MDLGGTEVAKFTGLNSGYERDVQKDLERVS